MPIRRPLLSDLRTSRCFRIVLRPSPRSPTVRHGGGRGRAPPAGRTGPAEPDRSSAGLTVEARHLGVITDRRPAAWGFCIPTLCRPRFAAKDCLTMPGETEL